MDQQGMSGLQPPTGPGGRRLHIAHRRSPSELTPLMMEQLAIQQQIEALQQQQQQIAATHQQYMNMGIIPPQQHLPGGNPYAPNQNAVQGLSPQPNSFQFPQQYQQQQLGVPMNAPQQISHRRNQSALPNMGAGPPPAPSSGAAGSAYTTDYNPANPSSAGPSASQSQQQQSRENMPPRGGRGGGSSGGHARRHSLALPEAKKAAELAEQKRKTSGFQFPLPGATGATSTSPSQPLSPSSNDTAPPQQPSSNLKPVSRGSAHGRSQSMAVGGGRGGMQARGNGNFQFPQASSPAEATSDFQRRGSGHNRSASRNFEGNWRQPNNNLNINNNQQNLQEQQTNTMGNFNMNQASMGATFQPGHRSRGSMNQSMGSIANFQYAGQPLMQLPQGQIVMQQPQMYAGQGLNQAQLAQLQVLQNAQATGQGLPGLQASQFAPGQINPQQQQQQQQQQRKTLFTPYLPQATLPALLSDGQLVAGILRVNKKNRSDAYVTTTDLDADIFICGSKDRNRALEGDLVAIELLDVDDVWGQKREKEEKKKRKDITDTRANNTAANDATTGGDSSAAADGGIRRRGSLRQRPTQKKNDDVEVEGQSLLLMEEEEINDEQKPLYAGHVVAVIERVAGQMFSGTLGLLRPSSQATKEKQEAERQARDGSGRNQPERQQEKPKIVWFKPTDKRVPLIAIPTEQAPRDFVEKHQDYANRIFVACIKRWPITSLHPFGTLVEQLGEMGDLKVETDALLRDNNFGPDEFSDAVLRSVGFDDWSVETDGDAAFEDRRDFRSAETFTIDPKGSKELDDAVHVKDNGDGTIEVGIHVADVAHFIKANSVVDREAKKRGTAVYLMNRTVNMLPSKLCNDICCLTPDQERYTISVVFKFDTRSGQAIEDDTWFGKGVIKSVGKLSYDEVDAVLAGNGDANLDSDKVEKIRTLQHVANAIRETRLGDRAAQVAPLRLLSQLDDENVPVEQNIFDSSQAHELVEELNHKANAFVAQKLADQLGDKAWLRRQASPNPRRLQTFAERMTRLGYEIDTTSSGSLQNSLFKVDDDGFRKGMETLLVKTMQRAKYCVAGKTLREDHPHFALNLPLYTHFTNPSRRYADIIVHRQLEAILAGDVSKFQEDVESLHKTSEICNTKTDSAHSAQEQSVHIESCRQIDRLRTDAGGDLICEGIVLCVYESAFDILIPEYGFEKRVHCDQLPLKKAEFDKNKRILELYWEKGVPSSAYIPEDERSNPGQIGRSNTFSTNQNESAKKQQQQESEEARRRQLETGTVSTDETDALFDDDEDEEIASITDATAGVSLANHESSRPSTANTAASNLGSSPESKITNKKQYLDWMKLREEGGNYIQDVTEMTRVPVILKTDLSKSPPCLTIRSVNPYAL